MNMITELRKRVAKHGEASINIDDFNRLQSEWIKRCGGEDEVKAIKDHSTILEELDSKIAVSSQEVTDQFGEQKMGVLIEDIEPILEQITK